MQFSADLFPFGSHSLVYLRDLAHLDFCDGATRCHFCLCVTVCLDQPGCEIQQAEPSPDIGVAGRLQGGRIGAALLLDRVFRLCAVCGAGAPSVALWLCAQKY